MTYTITQFANDTTPALPDLDQNFLAFGVLAPIPCSVAGTNALTLTQNSANEAASIALAAYQNNVQVCGIAAATSTGATTARVGALASLPVYKDTVAGVMATTGGEIVVGTAFTLFYDSTLNSNAGGWHLITSIPNASDVIAAIAGATIAPAVVNAGTVNATLLNSTSGLQVGATTSPTLTGLLSAQATLAFTSMVPNSSQDQSFTIPGLLSTDALAMRFPLPVSSGLTFSSYFAAGNTVAGTVTVRCANVTAASTITPGTITVGAKGIRTT
jgi:hypothetical protein